MNLRAENAIFIDDNPSNLEEVKYYNPGIGCFDASDISIKLLSELQFAGKQDKHHSRLNQYRILEKRVISKENYSSNEDFLRMSNIRIEIKKDCKEHVDRIYELIQRTNQLNYTKLRITISSLEKILDSREYECRYITVRDNFGDYGIVGFYALRGKTLIHFLFSCRILGFGVENYLYRKLGFPELQISGDITEVLDKNKKIDWICVENSEEKFQFEEKKATNKKESMLMIAGCDLEQASIYLKGNYKVDHEFATVINGREIRTSDTSQIVNSVILSEEMKNELCENLPFFDRSITFKTKIFNGDYRIIVFSVVDDYIRGMYRNIKEDYYIGVGGYYDQELFLERYEKEELCYLNENFVFVGSEDKEIFEKNLRYIISHINHNTSIILINGIDLNVSDMMGESFYNRNLEMNEVVDMVVNDYKNVHLLDMRKIVTDMKQLIKNDNRHFDRFTYYHMAEEISKICSEELKISEIKTKSIILEELKRQVNRVIRRLKKGIFSI